MRLAADRDRARHRDGVEPLQGQAAVLGEGHGTDPGVGRRGRIRDDGFQRIDTGAKIVMVRGGDLEVLGGGHSGGLAALGGRSRKHVGPKLMTGNGAVSGLLDLGADFSGHLLALHPHRDVGLPFPDLFGEGGLPACYFDGSR